MKPTNLIIVTTALVFGACGNSKGKEAEPMTCEVQAAKYAVSLGKQMTDRGLEPATWTATAPVVVTACNEDKWPAKVLSCLSAIRPGSTISTETCLHHLSAEQSKQLDDRILASLRATAGS